MGTDGNLIALLIHVSLCTRYEQPFQFRIVTQSKRILAVACIKLTPQTHRYDAEVCALTEGISDFLHSSGGHVPTYRPQRKIDAFTISYWSGVFRKSNLR